jgi:hypothetical protein
MSEDDYQLFILSVDDLEWTREWLGQRRCDSLLVWIAARPDVTPPVRIRAVESKSSTSPTPIDPDLTKDPFGGAAAQAVATLEALEDVLEVTQSHPLVRDLKFASFIEHLAAVALEQLHPVVAGDTRKVQICNTISDLSARSIGREDIYLDAMVVCTQYRTAAKMAVKRVDMERIGRRSLPIFLVRCGSYEVDQVLGSELGRFVLPPADDHEDEESTAVVDESAVPSPGDQETASSEELPSSGSGSPEQGEKAPEGHASDPPPSATNDRDMSELAHDLYLACRYRDIPVNAPDPATMTEGSTLIVIPMRLEPGSSIRTIESALEDLAREVGVESVDVENDPARPYHVRFLVARPNRVFPSLPSENAPIVSPDSGSYLGLYLGQDVEGRDVVSYVSSWPHLLVAGTTGSGKTTFIHSLLRQVNRFPDQVVGAVIVDGKGEFDYEGVLDDNHFSGEFLGVQHGHDRTLAVMEWAVETEIPRRRALVADQVKSAQGRLTARKLFADSVTNGDRPIVAPLLIVVDEFAEIMRGAPAMASEFERRIQQVSQIGRSTLVHLLLATQRPDANVVRGAIKANLDGRVALPSPLSPRLHDSSKWEGSREAARQRRFALPELKPGPDPTSGLQPTALEGQTTIAAKYFHRRERARADQLLQLPPVPNAACQ